MISIPIGLSLGFDIIGSSNLKVFGMDLLSFFDNINNTVLMPSCALLSCIAIGWFITPSKMISELEAEGNNFGVVKNFLKFMVKFIVPALILLVQVFGIIDIISTKGLNGLGVVLVGFAIIAVLITIYFIWLKNSETGTNADEIE